MLLFIDKNKKIQWRSGEMPGLLYHRRILCYLEWGTIVNGTDRPISDWDETQLSAGSLTIKP